VSSDIDSRRKYPAEYRTADGRWVRSKSEKILADWLYNHNIRYEYERKLADGVTCDFYLPDTDTYIEYWGRDDETYRRHRAEKEKFYSKHGFKLVSLDEKDLKHIDDVLRTTLSLTGLSLPPKPSAVQRSRWTSGPTGRVLALTITLVISALVLGYSLGGLGGYRSYPSLVTSSTQPIVIVTSETSATSLTSVTSETSSLRKWISSAENVISYLNAKKYIGQTKTVEGTIVRTYRYEKGNVIFLDFHDPYEGYFGVVIWSENWKNFPFAPEVFYKGKEVRVTGLIRDYKGSPQMEVTTPKQIEVAYMGFNYPTVAPSSSQTSAMIFRSTNIMTKQVMTLLVLERVHSWPGRSN